VIIQRSNHIYNDSETIAHLLIYRVLVCGIRNNGGRPCHRCLIKKAELFKLGSPSDTERQDEQRSSSEQRAKVAEAQTIIQEGRALSNDGLKSVLNPQCLAPVQVSLLPHLGYV
jgi:hypothetical protein